MWLLSALEFTHGVIIDICINDQGHGRNKIYCINGSDKTYLKQKICIKGTEEWNKEITRMNAASMICDNNQGFKFNIFLKNASSSVLLKIGKLI